MPLTSPSSSTAENRPWAVRHSTMREASTGPTPGRVSSAARSAVLSDTSPPAGPTGAPPPVPAPAPRRRRRVDRVTRRRHPHLLPVDEDAGEVDPAEVGGLGRPTRRLDGLPHPRTHGQAQHPRSPHLADDVDDHHPGCRPGPRRTHGRPRDPDGRRRRAGRPCGLLLPARDPDGCRPRAQAGRPRPGAAPRREDGALPCRAGPRHAQPEHGDGEGCDDDHPEDRGAARLPPRLAERRRHPHPTAGRQAAARAAPAPPVRGVLRPTSPHDRHRRTSPRHGSHPTHARRGCHQAARPPAARPAPSTGRARSARRRGGSPGGARALVARGPRGRDGWACEHARNPGAEPAVLAGRCGSTAGDRPAVDGARPDAALSERQTPGRHVSAQPPLPPREDVAPVSRQDDE